MSARTFAVADAVELAVVERSGFIESRHAGSAVLLDPTGTPALALGAIDEPVLVRSTLKPLQAIASMRMGADLQGEAAALATASHRAEQRHIDVVTDMLRSTGLDETALRCPSVPPGDRATREARTRAGHRRSPLHFNCSGKHAAFLAAARAIGADTATYLSPEHPVQQKVAEVVAAFASEEPSAVGIDGCGAPVFALSLTGLARAIGRVIRMGSSDDTEKEGAWAAYESEARTLTEAVFADPWTIEGHGRPNSTVIDELGVFAKGGAEGVIVMATRSGYSVALKCLDGSSRATGFVALTLLQRAGAFDAEPRGASATGNDKVDAVIAAITEPVTGGTDSEGRTNVVGRLKLGEDIATISERKRD